MGSVQSVLAMHSTQVPDASSQNGVGFGHGMRDEHAVGIGAAGGGFGGGGDGALAGASKSMSPVSRVVQPTTTVVTNTKEHTGARVVKRRARPSRRRITSGPTSMSR